MSVKRLFLSFILFATLISVFINSSNIVIKANEVITNNINIREKNYALLEVETKDLKSEQFYKIMVHYLAAVIYFYLYINSWV